MGLQVIKDEWLMVALPALGWYVDRFHSSKIRFKTPNRTFGGLPGLAILWPFQPTNHEEEVYGFIALVCCALVAQAQPTLVASTSNPVVNDAFTVYSFTPTANQQGSAGANQTWNFASLGSSTTLTSTMISPDRYALCIGSPDGNHR